MDWFEVIGPAAVPLLFEVPERCRAWGIPPWAMPWVAPLGGFAIFGLLRQCGLGVGGALTVSGIAYLSMLGVIVGYFTMCWPA